MFKIKVENVEIGEAGEKKEEDTGAVWIEEEIMGKEDGVGKKEWFLYFGLYTLLYTVFIYILIIDYIFTKDRLITEYFKYTIIFSYIINNQIIYSNPPLPTIPHKWTQNNAAYNQSYPNSTQCTNSSSVKNTA